MNVEDWDSCDIHESTFLRDSYCKDCRIDELKADHVNIMELVKAQNAQKALDEDRIAELEDELRQANIDLEGEIEPLPQEQSDE
jgi:hypothetical protein